MIQYILYMSRGAFLTRFQGITDDHAFIATDGSYESALAGSLRADSMSEHNHKADMFTGGFERHGFNMA